MNRKEYDEMADKMAIFLNSVDMEDVSYQQWRIWDNYRQMIIGHNRVARMSKPEGIILPVPEKIPFAYGYQIFIDGTYEGFYARNDAEGAKQEGRDLLEDIGKTGSIKVVKTRRYRD